MCEVVVAIGGWTVVFMGDETFRFMGFLVCYLFLLVQRITIEFLLSLFLLEFLLLLWLCFYCFVFIIVFFL